MGVIKIVGVGLISAAVAQVIRTCRPEYGLQASLAAGAVLLIYAIGELAGIFNAITTALNNYGLNVEYIGLVFKVIGVSYAIQFASDICKDAGEGAIASRVELCGKVLIVSLSLPMVFSVLDLISELLRGA